MGGTLLLADDSITIQKVVELTFAETEHSVVAVGNGRDLLARLEQVKPDIVLCDVVMPDMNGYEICQRIKSEPASLHIPVVLLTGTFEPFDRDRALAAGCDAIVTKPFEAKELIATVEDLLMRGQSLQETSAGEQEGETGGFGVPEGVQGIEFTTTGFDRMVPSPAPPELPPADGIEMTSSSFQSQVGPPAPPPPPELADDSGVDLSARPAAEPAVAASQADDVLTTSPEDQTTPSGPVPSAEERQAAALALLEAVERRTSTAPEPPSADEGFVFAPEAEPLGGPTELAPDAVGGSEPEPEPRVEPAAATTSAPAMGSEPQPAEQQPDDAPAPAAASTVAAPAPIAAPIELPSPEPGARELSQDEVDRISRRVLELAEPLIERIAWEVIPDMAEMLVRQRIRELEEIAEEES